MTGFPVVCVERFSGPKDKTRLTKKQAAKLRSQGGFKPLSLAWSRRRQKARVKLAGRVLAGYLGIPQVELFEDMKAGRLLREAGLRVSTDR